MRGYFIGLKTVSVSFKERREEEGGRRLKTAMKEGHSTLGQI